MSDAVTRPANALQSRSAGSHHLYYAAWLLSFPLFPDSSRCPHLSFRRIAFFQLTDIASKTLTKSPLAPFLHSYSLMGGDDASHLIALRASRVVSLENILKGETPMIKLFMAALCALTISFSGVARAAIIENGDLNFISGTGTASDGLGFLDMSFSVGLSQADALANARMTYVDARLATSSEFDDLYLAAGVVYIGQLTASDGFGAGASSFLALNDDGVTLLNAALGSTSSELSATLVWTDPDGTNTNSSTRDYLSMDLGGASLVQNTLASVPNSTLGWLLVVESQIMPVPEPSTGLLLSLGILGLGISRRRVAVRLNTRQ